MAEEYRRPGWYAAPDGEPGERWWNGATWSDSRRGVRAAPAPVALPSAPPPVYGADNPAPQRPDPYAPPTTLAAAVPRNSFTIDARQNRAATAGLITGLIGLFGITILGPIAVVLSLVGIAKASNLKAQGAPSSSIVFAAIGLVAGVIATVMLVIGVVAFFASITVDFR